MQLVLFFCQERMSVTTSFLSKEQFPHLRDLAQKMYCTYICESAFSIMKLIKSNTNRMANKTLDACVRLYRN